MNRLLLLFLHAFCLVVQLCPKQTQHKQEVKKNTVIIIISVASINAYNGDIEI